MMGIQAIKAYVTAVSWWKKKKRIKEREKHIYKTKQDNTLTILPSLITRLDIVRTNHTSCRCTMIYKNIDSHSTKSSP